MKRRAFSLLEVLIVLALVTLFLPIVFYPMRQAVHDSQIDIEKRQVAKAIRFALGQFFAMMHQTPIPLDTIHEGVITPIPLEWFDGAFSEPIRVQGTYLIRKKKRESQSEDPIQLWEVIFSLKTPLMKEKEAIELGYDFITRQEKLEKAST